MGRVVVGQVRNRGNGGEIRYGGGSRERGGTPFLHGVEDVRNGGSKKWEHGGARGELMAKILDMRCGVCDRGYARGMTRR